MSPYCLSHFFYVSLISLTLISHVSLISLIDFISSKPPKAKPLFVTIPQVELDIGDPQSCFIKILTILASQAWSKNFNGVTVGPFEGFFAQKLPCKRIFLRNEYSFEKLTKNQENVLFSLMSHNFRPQLVFNFRVVGLYFFNFLQCQFLRYAFWW